MPSLLVAFAENVVQFERAWYGMYEVTQSIITHVTANYEKIQELLSGEQKQGIIVEDVVKLNLLPTPTPPRRGICPSAVSFLFPSWEQGC